VKFKVGDLVLFKSCAFVLGVGGTTIFEEPRAPQTIGLVIGTNIRIDEHDGYIRVLWQDGVNSLIHPGQISAIAVDTSVEVTAINPQQNRK